MMKPSPVKILIIKEHRQKAMIISAFKVPSCEGSPARLVDRMCEAGNNKSFILDGNYNMQTTNYIT